MIASGNDNQFKILCQPSIFDKAEWLTDDRFSTNVARVQNRAAMVAAITEVLRTKSTAEWTEVITGKG